MKLEPIKKVNIAEQVFEQLKNQILSGTWKVGDRLPSENVMAEQFGVSRSSVRAAIRSLADYGLVEVRLGSGSYVAQQDSGLYINGVVRSRLDKKDILEVLDFCIILEGDTAGLAAQNITDEGVAELERIQAEIEAAGTDFDKSAELDKQFHTKIAELSGNTLINQTFTILSEPLKATIFEMYNILGPSEGLKYHQMLIEAMRARDVDQSVKIMNEHTINRKKRYLLMCEQ